MRKQNSHRFLGGLFVLALSSAPTAAQQSSTAVPVTTVTAEARPVAQTKDFVGRIEAIERVDIRARVTGYLEAVLFKEGDLVKEGQPLYRIEKDQYKAAVDQAQGALQGTKASKKLTQVELDRANQLLASTFGTPQKRDQAMADDENAAANIMKATADLETANINLGYTDITSPITGKVSRTKFTKGNVVSSESGVLTTVVSQDPMYVVFPVSQRELLAVRKQGDANRDSFEVAISFSDGTTYKYKGSINFVDVTVDRSTDTVTVRATLPNPDGLLIDGQLVGVKLDSGTPAEKIVIPQSALIADQEGPYVFAVQDAKAVIRRVTLGREAGADISIESGLTPGEQIIVEGIQALRPGATVLPSPLPPARS